MVKLTNTQKMLLPPDVAEMLEAGFLTPDLKISKDLSYFLEHLTFRDNKAKVVARAKEINKEKKEEDCCE